MELIANIKKSLGAFFKAFKLFFQKKVRQLKIFLPKAVATIKNFPNWLKRRPQAIKKWRLENKKKRKYHSFKLEKKLRPEPRDIPTAWQLSKQSVAFLAKHFWIFFSVMLIHAVLYIVLVYGPADFNLTEVQETIKAFFGGNGSSAASTFALLGTVLGANTQREGSSLFNFLIILSVSLATIWIIRRIYLKKPFKIRDAFYSGMAPAVPVMTILLVMTLQLLPFTITSYIYTVGRTSGVFISGVEDLIFFLIALFAGILSFYLMTPSILSLYAVTLPNMYPLHTIRLTKKIVKYRRFLVFRRIIALPLIIAILFFGLLLVLIRFYPQGGLWFVQIFPIVILPLIHIYLFKLYKSLI